MIKFKDLKRQCPWRKEYYFWGEDLPDERCEPVRSHIVGTRYKNFNKCTYPNCPLWTLEKLRRKHD